MKAFIKSNDPYKILLNDGLILKLSLYKLSLAFKYHFFFPQEKERYNVNIHI